MSKVYVVQEPMRRDQDGALKRVFDISPARRFGQVEYLLSSTTKPFKPDGVVETLRQGLRHYSSDDYLLLIGSPVLIGMVVAIAADFSDGFVRVLQWSGKRQDYKAIDIDLNFGGNK